MTDYFKPNDTDTVFTNSTREAFNEIITSKISNVIETEISTMMPVVFNKLFEAASKLSTNEFYILYKTDEYTSVVTIMNDIRLGSRYSIDYLMEHYDKLYAKIEEVKTKDD